MAITAAAIGLAAFQVARGVSKGVSAQKAAKVQAKLARAEGDRRSNLLISRANQERKNRSKLQGRARARRAGSGIDISGTPLLVEEERASNVELAVQTLLNEADAARIFGLNRRSILRQQGQAALREGIGGGISQGAGTLFAAQGAGAFAFEDEGSDSLVGSIGGGSDEFT